MCPIRWARCDTRPAGSASAGSWRFTRTTSPTRPPCFPPTELSGKFQRWAIPPHGTPGRETRMGTQLLKTYVAAGLPEPQIMIEAPAGGGPNWPGYEYLVETFRSLLPALPQLTGADAADMDLDTLAARVRDDVVSRQGIMMLPMMYGAWARKQSA